MSGMGLWRGLAVAGVAGLIAMPVWAQGSSDTEFEDRWVTGNLFFLAYHEVGHLLLDQIARLDQRNNRLAAEETADDIATWLISPEPGEDVDTSPAVSAIGGWLELADADRDGQTDAADMPDIDLYPDAETRAARIACLLIGSDTSRAREFAALRPIASLRFNIASCAGAYRELDQRMEGLFGDSDQVGENPVARVRVQYDRAGPALAEARSFLIASDVLGVLREDLVSYIGLPVDVVLRGAMCGDSSPGFVYAPERREILACYEEVDRFLFGEPPASQAGSARALSDGLGARPRRIAPRPPPPPPGVRR